MTRLFDIVFSFITMAILFPFMLPIMVGLKLSGEHYIFYLQPSTSPSTRKKPVLPAMRTNAFSRIFPPVPKELEQYMR